MNTFDAKSSLLKGSLAAFVCALSLGLAACEKKGPLEQAGEEVDEAVDTIKNGGEESTSNKVDDAVDEARDGASDAADELKKD
jgi:predicted small lipoprotein YifL